VPIPSPVEPPPVNSANITLLIWFISHQVLSQNKPASNNQSTIFFSQNKSNSEICRHRSIRGGLRGVRGELLPRLLLASTPNDPTLIFSHCSRIILSHWRGHKVIVTSQPMCCMTGLKAASVVLICCKRKYYEKVKKLCK
jgi:hypothetical protein